MIWDSRIEVIGLQKQDVLMYASRAIFPGLTTLDIDAFKPSEQSYYCKSSNCLLEVNLYSLALSNLKLRKGYNVITGVFN